MQKCKIQPKTTQRKFYNKWLYKVGLFLPGAFIFRYNSFDAIINQHDECSIKFYYRRQYADKDTIIKLAKFLQDQNAVWTKRIESDYIDFYTNDENFYETLSAKFERNVRHKFEPDLNSLDILDKKYTIAAKKLPFNRYNYRVYLDPVKCSFDERQSFINWIEQQGDKIKMTDAVKHWFNNAVVNWDRRYILVEDENLLLMAKLKCNQALGKVYTFEVADK